MIMISAVHRARLAKRSVLYLHGNKVYGAEGMGKARKCILNQLADRQDALSSR
jgi:hypothetical protein